MSPSDEDIAFLANSRNRVEVLEYLVDGPHSRHVLAEHTDVSRVTLSRILEDLESRHWITQRGNISEITTLGKWVIEEYLGFAATMDAERRLRRVFRWFPEEAYGFHIRHLADADITLVSRSDPSAPISEHINLFDVGGRFRSFSFAITSQLLEACREHVVTERITFEWVFTADVLEVLKTNQRMGAQAREMLESGRAEFRLYDDRIPYIVLISEESVNLRLADKEGSATALIQSDSDAVRTWAQAAFEEYWDHGTPVSGEQFTE